MCDWEVQIDRSEFFLFFFVLSCGVTVEQTVIWKRTLHCVLLYRLVLLKDMFCEDSGICSVF